MITKETFEKLEKMERHPDTNSASSFRGFSGLVKVLDVGDPEGGAFVALYKFGDVEPFVYIVSLASDDGVVELEEEDALEVLDVAYSRQIRPTADRERKEWDELQSPPDKKPDTN
jgi:hypothetical protein